MREFPWPETYVDPFQDASDRNWVFNACMDPAPTMSRYARAYREGAELMLRPLADSGGEDRGHNDLVVYPVVFCWRQFIELMLKDTLMMMRALSGKKGSASLHRHDLMPLWNELKVHLPDLGAPPEEVVIVEKTIARLADLDPDSFAFRYPKDKKGGSTQADVPVRINLRFLHEAMQNIANWLDQQMLGHENLASTQLYTQVSIRKLKEIHTATHPAARLERRHEEQGEDQPDVDPADVLAALDNEADEDGEGE